MPLPTDAPLATQAVTPGCRRPFLAGRGDRCLLSAGSAATDATPGRPKSIQDSPDARCRQCLRRAGWRRLCTAVTPPRGPRNGSCNGTRREREKSLS